MEIDFTFASIVSAIIKLLLLALTGYILRRRKITGDKFNDTLVEVLVKVLIPALIIHRTTMNFSFREFPFWWILPLAAIVFCFSGMLMGRLIYTLFFSKSAAGESKREFVSGCGFQNSGYLPMNIILFAFSGVIADTLLVYVFLFLTGFNLFIWSFLPFFFSPKNNRKLRVSAFLNPPVVATIVSLMWVWFFGKGTVPSVIRDPMGQLGNSAFPISMITLGAYLARYKAHLPERKMLVAAGIATKLLIFPAALLLFVYFLPMEHGYRFFLLLQAIMPSAVTLVVVGSYTGADNCYLSSAIFYSHIAAIFTIPLWLSVFKVLFGGG